MCRCMLVCVCSCGSMCERVNTFEHVRVKECYVYIGMCNVLAYWCARLNVASGLRPFIGLAHACFNPCVGMLSCLHQSEHACMLVCIYLCVYACVRVCVCVWLFGFVSVFLFVFVPVFVSVPVFV